ncbi:MAG: transposase [Actinomycetia bacterium]|nr:transposase [Actinomycetes bacterium]
MDASGGAAEGVGLQWRVAGRSLARTLSQILDSPEIQVLIGELEQKRSIGRRGYGVRALLGACLVKSLYWLLTWTRTADLIREHQGLQDVLGGAPSEWACYRFGRKLRAHRRLLDGCLAEVVAALRDDDPELGRDVAIDSTDLAAYANGQRYKYRGGPEREAFSDPDASWGHRSAVSTRKGGGFYGYKLHLAACSRTGLPLAWEIGSAKDADMRIAGPVLDRLDASPETVAMDAGYDYRSVYDACKQRGALAVIAARRRSGTGDGPIDRRSDRFKRLYRARSAVERQFGVLKHHFALGQIRVRGLDRVRLHADLCILARLTIALQDE